MNDTQENPALSSAADATPMRFRAPAIRRTVSAVGLTLALLPATPVAAAEPPAADPAAASAPATEVTAAKVIAAKPVHAAPGDPFEHANRRMYRVGMGLDRRIMGPLAHAYMAVFPAVVRDRIGNFFNNLGEPQTAINDTLQARPVSAGKTLARLVLNTTVGVGGLFDVASRLGVARSQADFGQTLGRYGVGTGPYLFIPFMGPSNVRDAAGSVVDAATNPISWLTAGLGYYAVAGGGVRVIDTRAQADSEIHALDDAIDPYATIRSAYLQTRTASVAQARGKAPDLPDYDDPASETASSQPVPSEGAPSETAPSKPIPSESVPSDTAPKTAPSDSAAE
jgi:phospholipid-binding lipoprotein MlaA